MTATPCCNSDRLRFVIVAQERPSPVRWHLEEIELGRVRASTHTQTQTKLSRRGRGQELEEDGSK